jgi:protein-disulfide isomerase
MKFPRLSACCLAAVLIGSGASAATMPDSGQDKRVEWKIQQTWPIAGKTLAMVNSLDGKWVFLLSDKQQVQVFNTQGQLQGSIPVDDGVSAIDISPQGELLYLINNTKQSFSSVAISFVVDIDTTGAPFKGPADAPVTMTLFTDFECPYCRQIIPLLDEVLEKNPKTVKLSFKNMPLKFHKLAEPSAKAALAAHEQGKFWPFHDKLFAEQKLTEETIKKTAVDLKLDIPRFEKDMESPGVQSKLQKDMLDAQSAGVTGTPTVFINGRTPRQRNLEGFQAIIDDELQKLGKK